MPLQVEVLYNDYDFVAAFAVASLLALLALVTLALKSALEWRHRDELASPPLTCRSAVEHVSKKLFALIPRSSDVSLTMRDRRVRRAARPVGLGQDDLAADPRRPRSAGRRRGAGSASATSPATSQRSRGIGFVFQHYALFGHMTVAQNIAFGLDVMKRSDAAVEGEIGERVEELLDAGPAARPRQAAIPSSCRAASASASPSPARSPASRASCCSTSRSARSTPRCARASRWPAPDPRRARPHLDLRHPRPGGSVRARRPRRAPESRPDRAIRHAGRDRGRAGERVRQRLLGVASGSIRCSTRSFTT